MYFFLIIRLLPLLLRNSYVTTNHTLNCASCQLKYGANDADSTADAVLAGFLEKQKGHAIKPAALDSWPFLFNNSSLTITVFYTWPALPAEYPIDPWPLPLVSAAAP